MFLELFVALAVIKQAVILFAHNAEPQSEVDLF